MVYNIKKRAFTQSNTETVTTSACIYPIENRKRNYIHVIDTHTIFPSTQAHIAISISIYTSRGMFRGKGRVWSALRVWLYFIFFVFSLSTVVKRYFTNLQGRFVYRTGGPVRLKIKDDTVRWQERPPLASLARKTRPYSDCLVWCLNKNIARTDILHERTW
jgi:hypothetical protein